MHTYNTYMYVCTLGYRDGHISGLRIHPTHAGPNHGRGKEGGERREEREEKPIDRRGFFLVGPGVSGTIALKIDLVVAAPMLTNQVVVVKWPDHLFHPNQRATGVEVLG